MVRFSLFFCTVLKYEFLLEFSKQRSCFSCWSRWQLTVLRGWDNLRATAAKNPLIIVWQMLENIVKRRNRNVKENRKVILDAHPKSDQHQNVRTNGCSGRQRHLTSVDLRRSKTTDRRRGNDGVYVVQFSRCHAVRLSIINRRHNTRQTVEPRLIASPDLRGQTHTTGPRCTSECPI